MLAHQYGKRHIQKQDFINITVLLAIAVGIGAYLIATTVIISKDGVFYIERAQQFSRDPIGVIKGHPFGYPFLIFAAHKLVCFFSNSSSIYTWIYAAQGVNLLCRIASFIPLYFIGKMLVGRGNSFWALLILAFLPYPTEFGSDAMRDWPAVFFLACGFWAILQAAKNRNLWAFGMGGICAGFGYMVRPVCVQVVAYGLVWLVYCLFRQAKTFSRRRILLATAVLVGGFLIPVTPYTAARGKILPDTLSKVIRSLASNKETHQPATIGMQIHPMTDKYNAGIQIRAVEAAGNLIEKAGANLMWGFAGPLVVGMYYHFRKTATQEEKLLMTAFIVFNVVALFLRYCYVHPDLTHRYILPLTVMTIFYIPRGLKLLGDWIVNRTRQTQVTTEEKSQRWFYTLLIIGLCICLPKLVWPIRIEKQGYLSAAMWLKQNTLSTDVIAAPDRRLFFYAERTGIIWQGGQVSERAGYLVKILKNRNQEPDSGKDMQKMYSCCVDKPNRKELVVIYKML